MGEPDAKTRLVDNRVYLVSTYRQCGRTINLSCLPKLRSFMPRMLRRQRPSRFFHLPLPLASPGEECSAMELHLRALLMHSYNNCRHVPWDLDPPSLSPLELGVNSYRYDGFTTSPPSRCCVERVRQYLAIWAFMLMINFCSNKDWSETTLPSPNSVGSKALSMGNHY